MTGGLVLGLMGMERAVAILVAAMPSAVSSVIFAAETRLNENWSLPSWPSPSASAW